VALYTHDSIERVREAVDMVALVSQRSDLRRVGTQWVGLCPFHEERTPSFAVNAEKKVYYCFACEAKGDAIAFVRETEALDFREAVERLADQYGVELELEREDPAEERRRRRRERLYAVLDRTARFYSTYLWEAQEAAPARDYLRGRGLSEEVLREFRVGWAPGAWDRLVTAARGDGFAPDELIDAGLAQRSRRGTFIDRFRGRITFPLADSRGRVLGFGARSLDGGDGPKYLNTAENDLYRKGRHLFGIDLARPHAARAGRIVVVEGYTDVLALHQAGIRESVAIMGTALTQEQLAELARSAPLVVLALDADRSGQAAMLRAARAAEDRGVELRVAEMPEGEDPADVVTRGGAVAFEEYLERAMGIVEFQVRRVLADADLDTPAGRDRALEEARKPIAVAPQPRTAERDEAVRFFADLIDVPAEYVAAGLERPGRQALPAERPARGAIDASAPERVFLALCAASGELGRSYLARLEDGHLGSAAARRARDHLRRQLEDPLADLSGEDPAVARLVTAVAVQGSEQDPAPEAVLEVSFLQLELRRVERELRRAAQSGDLTRQDVLAGERQRVRSEIDAVMGQTA
jgi:DNA primase